MRVWRKTSSMNEGGAAGGAEAIGTDALFGGQLLLQQFRVGHRAGTDAVLLAAAGEVAPGHRFVDAGAGAGAVGLWLGLRQPEAGGVLLEANPAVAELARRNVEANGLSGRLMVACVDLFDATACRAAGVEAGADLVVSNPPFHGSGSVRVSPDPGKAAAHVLPVGLDGDPHEHWARRLGDLLAPKGRLLVIHRPEAVPSLLRTLGTRCGGFLLKPIHPRAEAPAIRVLVGGIAGSKAPLQILPGLILHEADGTFTPEARAVNAGEPLGFWPTKNRPRRAGFRSPRSDQ